MLLCAVGAVLGTKLGRSDVGPIAQQSGKLRVTDTGSGKQAETYPRGSLLAATADGSVNKLPASGGFGAAVEAAERIVADEATTSLYVVTLEGLMNSGWPSLNNPATVADTQARAQFLQEIQQFFAAYRTAGQSSISYFLVPSCMQGASSKWQQALVNPGLVFVDELKIGPGTRADWDRAVGALRAQDQLNLQAMQALKSVQLGDCTSVGRTTPTGFGAD